MANYRQSVSDRFPAGGRWTVRAECVSSALTSQDSAVQDAQRALQLANNRYIGGVTSYLDVITAQSALLTNQRLATQLLGQQMVTSVYLVKALGGGWEAAQIQNEQVRPRPSRRSSNSSRDYFISSSTGLGPI